MIDPENEKLLTLSEGAHAVCPSRPVHLSTLYRWIENGVRGERLEAVYVGGRVLTSQEALRRFLARLNDAHVLPPEPPSAAAERAGAALVGKGC